MYRNRASVLRWQGAGDGLANTASTIVLEPVHIKSDLGYDGEYDGIYNGFWTQQTVLCLLAIFIELIMITVIIIITFVDVTLTMPGLFANTSRAWYVAATTIVSTLLCSFVANQIRLQWIHYIEMRRIRKADTSESSRKIENLLGIGPYSDYLYFWRTTIAFIVAGLNLAAVITAITPSIGLKTLPTIAELVPGALNCTAISNNTSPTDLNWRLADGTYMQLKQTKSGCLPLPANEMLSSIANSADDDMDYVYSIAGVGVTTSSIGVPFDGHLGPAGFDAVFWATSIPRRDRTCFEQSQQCLPVFTSNPVRCRAAGRVIVGKSNLTVELDDCKISTPIFGVNMTTEGASTSGVCTEDRPVGSATFLFGSINGHAPLLAAAIGDGSVPNTVNYSVACDIDIEAAVSFRTTYMSRTSMSWGGGKLETPFSNTITADFSISSEDDEDSMCTPQAFQPLWNPDNVNANVLTDDALAVGAGSVYPILNQGRFNDGWWESLSNTVNGRNKSSFAFESSTNAMEDVLGVVSAMSVGQYLGSQAPTTNREVPTLVNKDGTAQIVAERVGSGSKWTLVFIIPEAWIIILLIILMVKRLRL